MRSLRGRLLLAVLGATTLILLLLSGSIYWSLAAVLQRNFDRVLLTKAHAIASLVEGRGKELRFDQSDLQMPEYGASRQPKRTEYYEIWREGGEVVARSPALGNGNLVLKMPGREGTFESLLLPSGVWGRVYVLRFVATQDGDEGKEAAGPASAGIVAVAAPTHDMDEVMDDVETLLLSFGGAALLIACVLLWLLTKRALRPLEVVARQIAGINVDGLRTQLEVGETPLELLPVIDKLNDLLGRLGEAFARERAFSADVAHELRTPLAGLTTTLEVCASREREPEAYQAAVNKCLVMTKRMNGLVENLLLLARADARQLVLHVVETPLDELLLECFGPFGEAVGERSLAVSWDAESPLVVRTDREKLRLVLQNVFENAVTYADAGGRIVVTARVVREEVVVRISNSGSAVAAGDAVHVTERFWRADQSRTGTGAHCGLGLAIVRRMGELLGVGLTIETEVGKEFTVELRWPTAARGVEGSAGADQTALRLRSLPPATIAR